MEPNQLRAEDAFDVHGRGIVITGRVLSGNIELEMRCTNFADKEVSVKGIEIFMKKLDRAEAGQNVGLLLGGIEKKEEIRPGEILSFV